jgi:hypothetical protein
MRSRVVVLVLLLIFAMAVAVQAGGGIVTKGIKAGVNVAGVTGDDVDDSYESRTAFVGGVFLTYALTPALAVQPEILYSMKGYKWDDDMGCCGTGKLTYLEIPVLLKYMIPMDGVVQPNLFAGVAPAFLLSAEVEQDHEETMFQMLGASETVDIKDDTKSVDFGLVFGGGVDLALGEGLLMFDVRYTMGLTSIDDTDDDWDVKNKAITLMVGYGFK